MIELALQVVLVVLLLLTITWCVIVHFRLRRLRTEGSEMQAFVEALGEATARAEATIRLMRDTGREIESAALERERQARELGRLIENATRVTRRLEAAREQGAGQLAELRTRDDLASEPRQRPAEPPRAEPPVRGRDRIQEPRPNQPRGGQPRGDQPEARLDGLLHGELLEALQALR